MVCSTSKRTNIVLNLGDVDYIDSSGIGELVSAYTTAKGRGGELKLLHLTKKVHDLLQLTKLYTVFDVYTDESIALAVSSNLLLAAATSSPKSFHRSPPRSDCRTIPFGLRDTASMNSSPETEWIVNQAIAHGFDLCGVVRSEKFPELDSGTRMAGTWLCRRDEISLTTRADQIPKA